MFEDYLEDAHHFTLEAQKHKNEREAKRYFRASVFYTLASIEAFVNFVGDTLAQGTKSKIYETAFLTDKKFGIEEGDFRILEQVEYHRLEDKLRFLLCKFVPSFDFANNPAWGQFIEFKRFRDDLTHPRKNEDNIEIVEYRRRLTTGLWSVIQIMNCLCQGIFDKPLRKRLTDLMP